MTPLSWIPYWGRKNRVVTIAITGRILHWMKKNIIEIRIANHFGTKSGILDKSNNKSQYLYQVVLITTPPMPQTNNSITTTTNVGNVKVITKGYIGESTTINDIKELLAEIHDYLIAPATSFDVENNNDMNENRTMAKKQVIRLSESQLIQIVKESFKRVLNEGKVINHKPYFFRDGINKEKPIKPGEYADSTHNMIRFYKQLKSDGSSTPETRIDALGDYCNGLDKHNARRNNYIRKEPNSDSNLVHFASKEGEEAEQKERLMKRKEAAKNQKKFKDMLSFNAISAEDYKALSDDERREMWDVYYMYGPPAYDRPSAVWLDGGEYSSGWIPSRHGEY